MITPKEFKEEMQKLEELYGNGKDEEEFHIEADHLICKVMANLGYYDGIRIFERNSKWWS